MAPALCNPERTAMIMARVYVDTNVIAHFCRQHAIREMSLFGSVTRDDFRPDSDVDVLVEFEPGAGIDLFDLVEIREELKTVFGRDVDVVTTRMLSPYFRDDVLAHREVVYVGS